MKVFDNIDFNGIKVELLGTFMFFYVGGWAVINTATAANFDDSSCALAHMITLGLMIWSGSFVSGGHFNPAVTTTFIVFKRIHWLKGLFYILAQLLGGLFAAALLKVIVSVDNSELTLGKSVNGFPILQSGFSWWKQSIIEFIGTFFLMTVVYMTAVDKRASSDPVHGMAIGGVVGFMLLAGPPGSASAFNPARAFCPMLIDCTNGQFQWVWIWIVFPIAGAITAGLMCEWFLEGAGEEPVQGSIALKVQVEGDAGYDANVELDLGADMTTPMKETGDIQLDVEVDLGVTAGVSMNVDAPTMEFEVEVDVEAPVVEIEVEVEAPEVELEVEVEVAIGGGLEIELDAELGLEIEIDAEVDVNAWGVKVEGANAPWSGFYVQGGIENDMKFDDMSIGFDGGIAGSGSDANGGFTIEGTMGGDAAFTFNKTYESGVVVVYSGNMDGTSMKGNWNLPDQDPEEFEISLSANSWNGWFEQGGDKNGMDLNLTAQNGGVFGSGTDEVGPFVCRGTHDEGSGDFNFAKQYIGQHQVLYFGKAKGDSGSMRVQGKWSIPGNCDGTFLLQES